jgi:hypothetical protein
MTLNQLEAAITPAELTLWSVYFDMKAEDRRREAGQP